MHLDQLEERIAGTDTETVLLSAAEANGHVAFSELAHAVDGDRARAAEAVDELRFLELLTNDERGGSVELNGRGRQLAAAMQRSLLSGPRRWDAVQRAIIDALLTKQPWQDLVVNGQPVAREELELAAGRLDEWGYVKQMRGDNTVYAMHLLPRGHEVPGLTGMIAQHHSGASSSHVDNSAHVNVRDSTVAGIQTGGSNNTMDVTQTVTLTTGEQAQVLKILAQVEAILRDADTDVEELGAAVATLTREASLPAPLKPTLRQRVLEAMVLAGATEGVDQVSHLLAQLLGLTS